MSEPTTDAGHDGSGLHSQTVKVCLGCLEAKLATAAEARDAALAELEAKVLDARSRLKSHAGTPYPFANPTEWEATDADMNVAARYAYGVVLSALALLRQQGGRG